MSYDKDINIDDKKYEEPDPRIEEINKLLNEAHRRQYVPRTLVDELIEAVDLLEFVDSGDADSPAWLAVRAAIAAIQEKE